MIDVVSAPNQHTHPGLLALASKESKLTNLSRHMGRAAKFRADTFSNYPSTLEKDPRQSQSYFIEIGPFWCQRPPEVKYRQR